MNTSSRYHVTELTPQSHRVAVALNDAAEEAELATRYGHFQVSDRPRDCYVTCPLCRARVDACLGYGEQLGRGAAGRRTRALRDAVRDHLIDICARTHEGEIT